MKIDIEPFAGRNTFVVRIRPGARFRHRRIRLSETRETGRVYRPPARRPESLRPAAFPGFATGTIPSPAARASGWINA